MKKTVLYARVSTNDQTTEQQIEACAKYANSINLEIHQTILDEGISAYSTSYTEREGLMQVIESASKGLIENLIIFSTDRLSRDHLQGQIIINQLTQYGVKIFSVNEGHVNKTEIDNLLNSIRFFQNQIESKKTSQRIIAKKDLMAQQGRWQGNHLPIGYTVEDGFIVVDESLRPIAIDIFETYLKYGSNATVKHLQNKYNIKVCRVIDMLKNRTYVGYPYKGKEYYFKDLQIISNELWNSVQSSIKLRTTKGDTITDKTNCLLEGILYHKCGAKMHISKEKKNKYTYYRCKCNLKPKNFTQYKVDDIIDNIISDWFKCLDKDELLHRFNSKENKQSKLLLAQQRMKQDLLSTKKAMLGNANKKLQDAILQDYPLDMIKILTDSINELKTAISALESELHTLEEQLKSEQVIANKQLVLTEKLLDFKYLYSKATRSEKKLLIRNIVEKIIITDYDNIEIIYRY